MTERLFSADSEPHVAILLAVHAAANVQHLDEALESMRAQTYPNTRLFVFADGPLTPKHEDVLEKRLRAADGWDRIVRGARPAGLPAGLNQLIDVALADPCVGFLARMDADDISLPTRIERQVSFFQDHPDVDIAGTWCIEFTQPSVATFHKQLPCEQHDVRRFMLYRSPLAHPTVMFRREVLEAGHRYSSALKIMQDYEFWSRLMSAGYVISNVPEYLLWFRMAEGFYGRRAGVERAWGELKMRWNYARSAGLLRPHHLLAFAALFAIRMSPDAIKRLAYKHMR